jgi:hypothetical protein
VLAVLDAEVREHLEAMASVTLTKLTLNRAKADHNCQLSDEFVCTPDTCPMKREAVPKSATHGER